MKILHQCLWLLLTTLNRDFPSEWNRCPVYLNLANLIDTGDLFSIRVLFHIHWWFTRQHEKGVDHLLFHSTTHELTPPARKDSDIYLQLCVWHDVFLIASLPFTRLLLYETYDPYRINIWFMDDALLIFVNLLDSREGGGVYSNLTPEIGGCELASTITLVIQANRLTKSASHTDYNFGRSTLVR